MQLSFKVIKNDHVSSQGCKEISTKFSKPEICKENENNIKNSFGSYESLVATMLDNARKQSEIIIAKASEQAQNLEDEAKSNVEQIKQQAYNDGYEEGSNKGYQDAYNDTVTKTSIECENKLQQANDSLWEARRIYDEYLEQKKQEIKDFIFGSVEGILKQKIEDEDSLTNMIYDALSQEKNAKSFIIRCNNTYVEPLKSQVDIWKQKIPFNGDLFILKDDSLENGTAVIDKGNGKLVVSANYALEKIKEILEGND